jgi:phenylpyruvate tautomerase PptA (4-oxalocrotonate tautomerase family)
MPHLQVRLATDELDGDVEPRLIASLTDAIVAVYGEWARPIAVIDIEGIPAGRSGVGGVRTAVAPIAVMGVRPDALYPPDGDARAAALIESLTAAVGTVLGAPTAERTTVVVRPESEEAG